MSTSKVPQLPPTNDGEVNSLRYEVNPAVALNALNHIYQHVQQYQLQLRQLAQSIHRVYAEGPVISGWLASEASLYSVAGTHGEVSLTKNTSLNPAYHAVAQGDEHSAALFRHGDADDLMNYLSALESTDVAPAADDVTRHSASNRADMEAPQSSHSVGGSSQYYLCQLDSSGQIQAEKCPSDQVPVLSMAIARYRRLNQLITQKQGIETKLQALVDILGDAQRVIAAD